MRSRAAWLGQSHSFEYFWSDLWEDLVSRISRSRGPPSPGIAVPMSRPPMHHLR